MKTTAVVLKKLDGILKLVKIVCAEISEVSRILNMIQHESTQSTEFCRSKITNNRKYTFM